MGGFSGSKSLNNSFCNFWVGSTSPLNVSSKSMNLNFCFSSRILFSRSKSSQYSSMMESSMSLESESSVAPRSKSLATFFFFGLADFGVAAWLNKCSCSSFSLKFSSFLNSSRSLLLSALLRARILRSTSSWGLPCKSRLLDFSAFCVSYWWPVDEDLHSWKYIQFLWRSLTFSTSTS